MDLAALTIDDRLAHVITRLDTLRALDPPQPGRSWVVGADGERGDGHEIFGANVHGYRSRPLAGEQVRLLEAAMGVGLPAAFRSFVLRIGAGAGPDYGIYDFERLLSGSGPECFRPFPEGDEGLFYADDDDHNGLLDGYLPIIETGCGGYVGLVTSGLRRGHVVRFDTNPRGEWFIGPGFLDFYEEWLDTSTIMLGSSGAPAPEA